MSLKWDKGIYIFFSFYTFWQYGKSTDAANSQFRWHVRVYPWCAQLFGVHVHVWMCNLTSLLANLYAAKLTNKNIKVKWELINSDWQMRTCSWCYSVPLPLLVCKTLWWVWVRGYVANLHVLSTKSHSLEATADW